MRVLIVEDDYMIAMDTETLLADAGCEVVGIAGTVPEALRMIAEIGCDGVLLDVNLHHVSSEPVAVELRRRGIPFVVLSGYRKEQETGAYSGAPHLTKPCKAPVLVAAVLALRA